MKTSELRKKTDKELEEMLKELKWNQVKASTSWGREKVDAQKAGLSTKAGGKKGQKTSMLRDLKRMTARIKTILKERENDN